MATPIAIAVVEHDDRFLIGQRPERVPLAGLWEFPGGKIEGAEAAEEAAARECEEEAGIRVEAVSRYPAHVQEYDHGRVELFFVACRIVDKSQTPKAPFRWVARDELANYEFPVGNGRILKLLAETGNRPQ